MIDLVSCSFIEHCNTYPFRHPLFDKMTMHDDVCHPPVIRCSPFPCATQQVPPGILYQPDGDLPHSGDHTQHIEGGTMRSVSHGLVECSRITYPNSLHIQPSGTRLNPCRLVWHILHRGRLLAHSCPWLSTSFPHMFVQSQG